MSLIKTVTVDGFFTREAANQIASVVYDLPYVPSEYGKEIQNFNMITDDVDEMFSSALGMNVEVDKESGIFRIPELMIHFESFESPKDWVFCVALQDSTFNLFEHKSGIENATQGYKFNYRNLFEWDLTVNYQLKPGQGILFRPWLFHSFNMGLVQTFRLREV